MMRFPMRRHLFITSLLSKPRAVIQGRVHWISRHLQKGNRVLGAKAHLVIFVSALSPNQTRCHKWHLQAAGLVHLEEEERKCIFAELGCLKSYKTAVIGLVY